MSIRWGLSFVLIVKPDIGLEVQDMNKDMGVPFKE